MAINLLPSEQKSKFKKQKSASYSKTQDFEIEMTGAEKLDKNKPGIKKTGVLSFFKKVVQKPKEDKKEEVEEKKSKKMPTTKVNLKQKITYKNIFSGQPKVEYHVPDRKPVAFKQKSRFGFVGKFSVPSDKKPSSDPKISIEKKVSIHEAKEQFPKYNSISTEKVLKPEHIKVKKAKVIEVNSVDHKGAGKRASAWQRFTTWLSGLFVGPKKDNKEFKDPDKISSLKGYPKPKDGKIEVIEEKKIFDYKDQKIGYETKLNEIDKKIGQPQQPKEKNKLISFATPVEVKEEINIMKEEPKQPQKPLYQPKEIRYGHQPDKQKNIISSDFIEEKTKIKMDKVIKDQESLEKNKKSKENWLNRLFNWASALFSKDKVKKDTKEIEKKTDLPQIPKPPIETATPKKEDQKIEETTEDKKANFVPVPATPSPPPIPSKHTLEKSEEETLAKSIAYAPVKDNKKPARQENIISSDFLEEKTNIKTKPEIKEDKPKKQDKETDDNWLKRLLNWVSGLFSKDKKDPAHLASQSEAGETSLREDKKKHEPSYIKEERIEKKIDLPQIPKPPIETATPNKEDQKIEETTEDKKADFVPPAPVIPPPSPETPALPSPKIPIPPPAPDKFESKESVKKSLDKNIAESIEKDKKVTEQISDKMSRPVGFNGDQMNWEVNLIPEESKEKEIPISKILILVMSVIIAVGVVFGGWLWANYYYNTISVTISEVDAEIANIQSQVAQYENIQGEAQALQQKIENVSLLLEKHIYWSEFFNKLEFYTLSKVYYNSMSADVNGTITLTAVSDTYENSIKQLYIFEEAEDFVTSVTISNISKSVASVADDQENEILDDQDSSATESVSFNINLTINPALFYYIN